MTKQSSKRKIQTSDLIIELCKRYDCEIYKLKMRIDNLEQQKRQIENIQIEEDNYSNNMIKKQYRRNGLTDAVREVMSCKRSMSIEDISRRVKLLGFKESSKMKTSLKARIGILLATGKNDFKRVKKGSYQLIEKR